MRILSLLMILLGLVLFLNLGRSVDAAQEPRNADIIVSLGGDTFGCRLAKARELYHQGYSDSGKIIYTGSNNLYDEQYSCSSRKSYLQDSGIDPDDTINIDETMISNTVEELLFIKAYMLRHHYSSVLFVSHPTHSGRILKFADLIAEYDEHGLHLMVVSTEPRWWDREHFYTNRQAIEESLKEVFKLVYGLIKYNTPLIYYTKYYEKVRTGEWEASLKRLEREDTK